MCSTCGCGSAQVRIGELPHTHSNDGKIPSIPQHSNPFVINGIAEIQKPDTANVQTRLLKIEQDVLGENNQYARLNRDFFKQNNILALNLVSSPGSGKTTLLASTLTSLKERKQCYVIEGDQQTENDANRIRATGVPALQINTGKGCHLDAKMVLEALAKLQPNPNSTVFIENVGNLVCPAEFDLGEFAKVAILSVTEGEDKPLKYPHMFMAAKLMIINKIDLLPYLNFDLEKCIAYAKQVNPNIQIFCLSATSGEGMETWLDWLESQTA
ncbi:hydrogenase nickel incorporation protein HypB [Actinobacillus lignieresii]|uniref:Hydrogenase maturation factor HypB n=1 Tax=Actinobacillus lignieresii TaxID=720 RepID=A0A380TZA2_ACTLI|nr:hydrogenase nickel incorporation protein HypB [Actinobacillus lignieresii]SUT94028.1 hydrogenase nickel incorporation protein HypB [Actinobacillus lignieresii]VEB26893.1 hydrogenase nickel incorporation protein HypB [Actinobacillus lignieresii]